MKARRKSSLSYSFVLLVKILLVYELQCLRNAKKSPLELANGEEGSFPLTNRLDGVMRGHFV